AAAPTAEPTAEPAAANAGKVRFKLMSQPSGARVFYRGKERGVTPFTLEIPSGQDGSVTVELTFAMEGYQMETVVTGGTGEVVLSQKLQKRRGGAGGGRHVEVASVSTDETVDEVEPVATPGGMSAPVMLAPTVSPASELPVAAAVGAASAAASDPTPAKGSATAGLALPVLPTAAVASARGDVLPYNEDMPRPELVDQGKDIIYTREAMAAKSSGVMIARCTITQQGRVEKCRTIKSVAHMERAVLDALTSRTYKPIVYKGYPVNVDYTFSMRLVAPRR
ncbi:TonB family protein, partial [Myxococcus sp. 1LA]